MRIAFRTDASLQIGTGHVMRCLTLAEALRSAGAECNFICREHTGNLIEQIAQRGFPVQVLHVDRKDDGAYDLEADMAAPNYAAWLGADWVVDAMQTKIAIGTTPVDWLIIDHYAIDARWEGSLRPLSRQIMVIDDLADRAHDCDILLDQNLGRSESDYGGLVADACTVLTGPSQALIREEFWQLRDEVKLSSKSCKNILVFFGGIDLDNYTERVVEILSAKDFSGIQVDVILGAQNLHIDKIKSLCCNFGFTCHVQTTEMANLMWNSDIYVGAGGGAILERVMMRLPSVSVAVADNQIRPLSILAEAGACIYLGPGRLISNLQLKMGILRAFEVLECLTMNSEKLCEEFFSDRVHWSERLLTKLSG